MAFKENLVHFGVGGTETRAGQARIPDATVAPQYWWTKKQGTREEDGSTPATENADCCLGCSIL